MDYKFTNNYASSLAALLAAGATEMVVADATGLPTLDPGDEYYLTLESVNLLRIEIVKVTAAVGATLTIERAQEGTADQQFELGANVTLRLTAGALNRLFARKFSELTDVDQYPGNAGMVPVVNDTEDGLVFRPKAAKENGFVDRAESTLAFDNLTRTFSITPVAADFTYYHAGRRYIVSAQDSVVIPDTEGLHFVYYDADTLTVTQTFTPAIISTYAFICAVYWDADNDEAVLICEERHGDNMPWTTHVYHHETERTKWGNGLALGSMDVDGDGANDSAAQFLVTNGEIWDEDIQHLIADGLPQDLAPLLNSRTLYMSGASANWRAIASNAYGVTTTGTGRAAWNEWTGAVWQLSEVPNNSLVWYHLIAVGDMINGPVIKIPGQAYYGNVSAARDGLADEFANLSLGQLDALAPEFFIFASVLFETRDSYTNAVKSRVRSVDGGGDYHDWRLGQLGGGAPALGAHTHQTLKVADFIANDIRDNPTDDPDTPWGITLNASQTTGVWHKVLAVDLSAFTHAGGVLEFLEVSKYGRFLHQIHFRNSSGVPTAHLDYLIHAWEQPGAAASAVPKMTRVGSVLTIYQMGRTQYVGAWRINELAGRYDVRSAITWYDIDEDPAASPDEEFDARYVNQLLGPGVQVGSDSDVAEPKISVVAAMPGTPDANTIYFVTG